MRAYRGVRLISKSRAQSLMSIKIKILLRDLARSKAETVAVSRRLLSNYI